MTKRGAAIERAILERLARGPVPTTRLLLELGLSYGGLTRALARLTVRERVRCRREEIQFGFPERVWWLT
jgi:hypothetical protein